MDELDIVHNELAEQNEDETMPILASGKTLYITENTTGFDYSSMLCQFVQAVNTGDILAKIQAGSQYVVQISA